jgi:hypothetical protein
MDGSGGGISRLGDPAGRSLTLLVVSLERIVLLNTEVLYGVLRILISRNINSIRAGDPHHGSLLTGKYRQEDAEAKN